MENVKVEVCTYNKICAYIYNNRLITYKFTIFLLRTEIEFWYKIINNF